MQAIYHWVRNLAGYFIFLAALEQILPGKNDAKYVRLFAGIIFILLVMQPFADSTGLTERMIGIYRELEFQNDAKDLKKELLGVENRQMDRLFMQYENAIACDIQGMAEDMGIIVGDVDVTICREEDSKEFGTVISVKIKTMGTASNSQGTGGQVRVSNEEKAKLHAKIRSYYQLEDSDVEIQSVEGER